MISYEPSSEGGLVAVAEVVIGIDRRTFRLPIGVWEGDAPVGGLAGAPVVACADPHAVPLVRAGASRAGVAPVVIVVRSHAGLARDLLAAVDAGAELIVATSGERKVLVAARALGGRPLPALPLRDPAALRSLFEDLEVDVDVPVPSADGPLRDEIRAAIEPLRLETVHHLVEVDPRPAFEEAGRPIRDADLNELGAAAAGVLAGRVAAANRRWHDELREG